MAAAIAAMPTLLMPPPSRLPTGPAGWRPFFIVTLSLATLVLAWDISGLDLAVMRALGTTQGFALRHHPLLERVLHDDMRQVTTAGFVLALAVLTRWPRRWPWSERAAVALGMVLALAVVNAIKRNSLTSCPWELQTFGGVAQYVSHWAWGVTDGGSGRCFPGGHASGLAALLPLALPGLAAVEATTRRRAALLLAALMAGTAGLGLVQTLRGAHYPSHTLWTLWLCWTAGGLPWAAYRAWLHWRPCPGTPNSNSTTSAAMAPPA